MSAPTAPLAPVVAAGGHVVVCGLHDEGLRVVEQLTRAGAAAVVVDDEPDEDLLATLDDLAVPFLRADAGLPATMDAAGLTTAVALVCVESDDLQTLAITLLARELRADLRVVVALRNAPVARALADLDVAVLDVATLAAPSIADACLQSGRWRLTLDGVELWVAEATSPADGTWRDLYGDLTPVAVVTGPAADAPAGLTPARDDRVAAGDRVVVLGTAEDLERAGVPPATDPTAEVRSGRRRTHRWAVLRDVLRDLDRRVLAALGGLVALMAVSTTVLRVGYREPDGSGMSTLDAVYFTVETIGTVGFGDFYFRDQDPWLRVWAIALMVLGATLTALFFAFLTNALVSARLEQVLGHRLLTGLDDHVVVVGAGSVGLAVARRLKAAGVDVVVLDRDPQHRFRNELRASRVPVLTADARVPDTWRRLRLERARAVAVVTSDDLANLETGLAVRDLLGPRWAEVPVPIRVFDRRLTATVAGSFGFRHVRSPAALAAPWFVGAALGLDVLSTFYVGDRLVLAARLRVAAGDGLDGLALADLPARVRVVLLTHADGRTEQPPRRESLLEAGSTAYVVGPYAELLVLLRSAAVSA